MNCEQQNMKTFVLYSMPFLDTYNQCYKNIVTVNFVPSGPLGRFVHKVPLPRLSPFKEPSYCCERMLFCLAIGKTCFNKVQSGLNYRNNLMTTDEIPNLFSFLLENGYKIDTELTKIMNSCGDIRFHTDNSNKIICFVTYQGDEIK